LLKSSDWRYVSGPGEKVRDRNRITLSAIGRHGDEMSLACTIFAIDRPGRGMKIWENSQKAVIACSEQQ
jgi:hypothetical protein